MRPLLRLGVIGIPALFLTATLVIRPVFATYLWGFFGVAPLYPRFADTRVITSGWDCARRGIDVLRSNPCDPWNRPMNYPRLWLLPGYLGLGSEATPYVAITLVTIFLISVFLLLGPVSARQALYYLLVMFSFPVMLLIERGNNDLLIFALLVGIAATLAWNDSLGPTNAAALVVLAAGLKLYPVAAVHALFLRLRGRLQLLTLAVAAIVAGYIFVIRQDLVLIQASTPKPTFAGYGLNVLIHQVLDDVNQLFQVRTPDRVELAVRGVVLVMLVVLGLVLARRLPRERLDLQTRRGRFVGLLFSLGATVYILTFVLGNNYDYRLTFLLLTLPQLFAWLESPSLFSEARAVLATILLSLWLAQIVVHPVFQIDQLALYGLFVYFIAVLVRVTLDQPDIALLLPRKKGVAPSPL